MTVNSIVITQNNLLAGGCNLYNIMNEYPSFYQYDRKSMNGIEPLPPPSTKGACPLHHMDTFDIRLITPFVYFHEKLSERSHT